MSPKRRTLREMSADANGHGDDICCPNCHCRDFLIYGHQRGTTSVLLRYKRCRHCGHQILTATESRERIIRNIH